MAGTPVSALTALTAPTSPEQLRSWLTKRICYYLDRSGDPIDGAVPLGQYGLDSVYAFALCGDIEEMLGIGVDPQCIWVHNTLDALSRHLYDKISISIA